MWRELQILTVHRFDVTVKALDLYVGIYLEQYGEIVMPGVNRNMSVCPVT